MPAKVVEVALDHTQATYSPANALWLARVAQMAYKTEVGADKTIAARKFADSLNFIGSRRFQSRLTDTEGFGMYQKDTCAVIAFQGTELLPGHRGGLVDAITDARAQFGEVAKLWGPGNLTGRIHTGFADALNSKLIQTSVWEQVQDFLGQFPKTFPVVFTGHSLGGALAILAAARRYHETGIAHLVYTYGQPRVGDATFCTALDAAMKARIHRLVNKTDAVPRVPTRFLEYRHAGLDHRILGDGPLGKDRLDDEKLVIEDFGAITFQQLPALIALLAARSPKSSGLSKLKLGLTVKSVLDSLKGVDLRKVSFESLPHDTQSVLDAVAELRTLKHFNAPQALANHAMEEYIKALEKLPKG